MNVGEVGGARQDKTKSRKFGEFRKGGDEVGCTDIARYVEYLEIDQTEHREGDISKIARLIGGHENLQRAESGGVGDCGEQHADCLVVRSRYEGQIELR